MLNKKIERKEKERLTSGRPISRVEVKSLRERVQLLEGLLREHPSPPSNSLLPSQQGLLEPNDVQSHQYRASSYTNTFIIPDQAVDPLRFSENLKDIHSNSSCNNASSTSNPTLSTAHTMSDGPSKPLLERLFSTSSNPTFNPSSRRIDYFGPTKDFYLDSENTFVGSPKQDKRAERVLRDLSPAVNDHLMNAFWQYYKPFTCFIDKEGFYADMNSGGTQSYSGFLHVCVLAMGFRFADIKAPDIVKLSLSNRESVLHREAKYLAEFELEKPGAEPSVQALLILSALESGCGRDTIGWMYAGMWTFLPTTPRNSDFNFRLTYCAYTRNGLPNGL
jgi:hypothetical protein